MKDILQWFHYYLYIHNHTDKHKILCRIEINEYFGAIRKVYSALLLMCITILSKTFQLSINSPKLIENAKQHLYCRILIPRCIAYQPYSSDAFSTSDACTHDTDVLTMEIRQAGFIRSVNPSNARIDHISA